MQPVMERYLPALGTQERLPGSALELLVLHWLNEIAFNGKQPEGDPERLLSTSGFLDSLHGSLILVETGA